MSTKYSNYRTESLRSVVITGYLGSYKVTANTFRPFLTLLRFEKWSTPSCISRYLDDILISFFKNNFHNAQYIDSVFLKSS